MAGKGGAKKRKRELEVLDAATDIFSRKGFDGASVQDVADALGMLKGSLYYYIDSKEDLLFRIFDRVHDEASVIVQETTVIEEPPLTRLRIYLERYITFFLKDIRRMSLYVREWQHLDTQHRTRIIKQRKLYEDFIVGLILEAQDRHEVSVTVDARYATFFITGAISSLPDWYNPRGPESPATIAQRYADYALGVVHAPHADEAPSAPAQAG